MRTLDGWYRKIPVTIRAARVDALVDAAISDWASLPAWVVAAYDRGDVLLTSDYVLVRTLEGEMRGGRDEWLIEGVKGEIYPCKPDVFDVTYEPAAGGDRAG